MNNALDPIILVPLLAIVAKNLVELLKHLANVGGDEDPTYTPRKGMYAAAAPIMLGLLAAVAENQGVTLDLLGQLGMDTTSPLLGAVLSGIVVGLAAPEAYDVQNLLKAKVQTNTQTAEAVKVQSDALAIRAGLMVVDGGPTVADTTLG